MKRSRLAGEMVATLLPPASEGAVAQQQAIDRLHDRLKMDIALFDKDLQRIAAVGRPLPRPRRESAGWVLGQGGPAWAVRLPDDRWVVARMPGAPGPTLVSIVGFLGAIALAVAICAYPLVRRLTRRLERLQAGVEQLAAGDLAARVKIEGKDEVARLAESFNRAAVRIEELVGSHKLLLANASHELRTPLSRIRLGVEFLKEAADPMRRRELERDIAELDQLIDEILLSSRLDAVRGLDQRRRDRSARARGRGRRPLRAVLRHRATCRRAGRPGTAAPDDAQPDRERRAPRGASDRDRGGA